MTCELLLLDYDGTLCDTKPAILHAMEHTFASFGQVAPSVEQANQLIMQGVPIGKAFTLLVGEADEDEARWAGRYREIYREESDLLTRLYPHVLETLQTIHRQNIPIVVLSNKGIAAVEKSLAQFGLDVLVSLVIGDGMVTSKKMEMKPSPMVFAEIIRPRFPSIPRENILMTGDTQADIRFANNCGIQSCWAAYGYGHVEETRAAGPHFTIQTFQELENIVRQ